MALSGCHRRSEKASSPLPQSIDTLPMLVMQVRQCSRLYTAEYNIHKIVTHEDDVRLKGKLLSKEYDIKVPVGQRKVAIPVDARLKAYIDFSQFSEKNIERKGEKVTIILPDPKVALTSTKVDQQHIKTFVPLTRSNFSDAELTNYEQQGRQSIINSIPRLGIIETARANAAAVLIPTFVRMGFKEEDITVAFRKQYTNSDLKTILE